MKDISWRIYSHNGGRSTTMAVEISPDITDILHRNYVANLARELEDFLGTSGAREIKNLEGTYRIIMSAASAEDFVDTVKFITDKLFD